MFGLKDARRAEGAPRGVPGRGASPRRDDVDDFLPSVGVEERKLATLGLRRTAFAGAAGLSGIPGRTDGG
jgi:hypothetical protein